MTDPCGGNTRGGDGCRCDPPFGGTMSEAPPRTISDAEAIEKIIARYRTFGQEDIFEDASSLIEFIGYTLEETGRQAWFEEPSYVEAEQ